MNISLKGNKYDPHLCRYSKTYDIRLTTSTSGYLVGWLMLVDGLISPCGQSEIQIYIITK